MLRLLLFCLCAFFVSCLEELHFLPQSYDVALLLLYLTQRTFPLVLFLLLHSRDIHIFPLQCPPQICQLNFSLLQLARKLIPYTFLFNLALYQLCFCFNEVFFHFLQFLLFLQRQLSQLPLFSQLLLSIRVQDLVFLLNVPERDFEGLKLQLVVFEFPLNECLFFEDFLSFLEILVILNVCLIGK